MKVAYAIERGTNALVTVGMAKLDTNRLSINFVADRLARLASGELLGFLLVAPSALSEWPSALPNLGGIPASTKLFSNVRGKLANHRPATWEGWPLLLTEAGLVHLQQRAGEPTRQTGLVVLKSIVPIAKQLDYELSHDGFLVHYEGTKKSAPRQARGLPEAEVVHSETVDAGVDRFLGSFSEEEAPSTLANAPHCAYCNTPILMHKSGYPQCANGHVVGTCLPPWVLEAEGPSYATVKVRLAEPAAGFEAGAEVLAERCPIVDGAVWVRHANGYGYRIPKDRWQPVTVRQARAL